LKIAFISLAVLDAVNKEMHLREISDTQMQAVDRPWPRKSRKYDITRKNLPKFAAKAVIYYLSEDI